ncbi:MAG: hypothetical protein KKE86_11325, partial [Planctomycetes bacterium]|nr:hypothetical protein [Planctomycetota bacterium]
TIRFTPATTSPVPMAGAVIADGKYRVDAGGGAAVGTYKVQIEAYDDVMRPYVPEKYNVKTQLEITIQPGSREITKDFELTD